MGYSELIVFSLIAVALSFLMALSCFDAAERRLNPSKCWIILALAALLSATSVKIIPGGPFLSIHSEILPAVACLLAFFLAAMALRNSSPARRLLFIGAMGFSLGLTGIIIASVVSFCRSPFARGDLFGW